MSRINVDLSLFSDLRFRKLVRLMEGEDVKREFATFTAIGMLVEFWRIAQKSWVDGQGGIPKEDFLAEGFGDILIVGLAEEQGGEVFAKGSATYFQWLIDLREAGRKGGLKSAETRRNRSHAEAELKPSFRSPEPISPAPAPAPDISPVNAPVLKNKKSVEVMLTSPPAVTHSLENFVLNLSADAREKIQSIYPEEEFVRREVEKMKVWLGANQRKAPKSRSGWTRFVMGWLERGWERWRKTMPSVPHEHNWSKFWEEVEHGTV